MNKTLLKQLGLQLLVVVIGVIAATVIMSKNETIRDLTAGETE